MLTCDIDPDVLRWGLQDLQVCVFTHSGTSGSLIQYERDNSQTGRVGEGYCEAECVNVENDAVIARVLQEELSRVAAAESSGYSNPGQDSIVSQDWFGFPTRQHIYGHDADRKVLEDPNQTEQSTNEVNDGKELNDSTMSRYEKGGDCGMGDKVGAHEDMLRVDIIDESSVLDGEVEKRLNDMVAIPHVPKINGEIPSVDEEVSDHQRLLDRLQLYGLVENKVQGDGNCQFRSLSDQLYRSQEHHKVVRELVVSQLKSHPEMYEGYVPMGYADYLKKMNKNGEWGDHVTLQAAADSYGVKIFVLTSFKDTCYIEILPHIQKSERIIFVSFWAEVHYNSIYPEGGEKEGAAMFSSLDILQLRLDGEKAKVDGETDEAVNITGLCTLAELQPGPVEWFAEHYYLRFDNKDVDEYKQLHYPSPEFGTLRACFEVSGSVNGLVFLVDEKGFAYDYILWNPLIKKLVRLPQPGVTFTSYGPHHRAFTGFGFDSKTNDYKVLRFVESLFNAPGKEPEVEVEIYSLNANCWRSITHIAPKYSLSRTSPRSYANCFVNGAIHRLATDKDRNLILAFDVSDQVFREIPLPECLSNVKPMSLIRLLKYGQSIAALTWDWDLRDANIKVEQIHMWVMKEYGVAMSWTFMEVAESVQRVLFFRHDEEQMFVPLEGGWIASVDIKNNHSEIFGSTLHTMKRKS
ncbi:Ovarian tumor, otubain [Corchorus olitorius]|uniref:ubiquitinyl hydrolase 1 n=1 Tax=Corchorus olitorius TaxID=93759 RepID=A0A1R3K268_9ROSI|nr:Ovarian tumor, otubain [Corchorus olitorius]